MDNFIQYNIQRYHKVKDIYFFRSVYSKGYGA